jgi:integrase
MPKRTRLKPPSYRLHKTTGQAIVTLTGRDYYLGPYDTDQSRNEYDRLVAVWLAHGRTMPPVEEDVPSLTVTEIIAAYLRYASRRYVKGGKPTGEMDYVKIALRELQRLYGHTPAVAFGPLRLRAVRAAMIQGRTSSQDSRHNGARKDGLSRSVVNGSTRRIVRMFKWAVSEELVPVSTYQALKAVEGLRRGEEGVRETRPVEPVPQAHIDAIQPHVSRQVWAMIQLQLLSGMRSQEVTLMRRCDLRTDQSPWVYRPQTHKTEHRERAREILLGPRAQEVIRPFLKFDLDAYLFSPADAERARNERKRLERKSPMTPSQSRRTPKKNRRYAPGEHYTTDSYRYAVARACRRASVPHWHPHQLRHNFGTAIRGRYGVETARALLGHRSIPTTEIYAELDRKIASEVASAVG